MVLGRYLVSNRQASMSTSIILSKFQVSGAMAICGVWNQNIQYSFRIFQGRNKAPGAHVGSFSRAIESIWLLGTDTSNIGYL